MTTWISLDWDFVTGDCREHNGSKCAQLCSDCDGPKEPGRGKGYGFPNCTLPDLRRWINRLNIIPPIIVRDSHAEIVRFLHRHDFVHNLDDHTDDYDDAAPKKLADVHCGNWVNYVRDRAVSVKQYNGCNDLPQLVTHELVRLFIAVSRPYTPKRRDGDLFRLLLDLGLSVDLHGSINLLAERKT